MDAAKEEMASPLTGIKTAEYSGNVNISGKSFHINVSDDDEGFVSGEEEFEVPPERPIEAETAAVGKNSDEPFPDSSEIAAPNTEKVGNSDVRVDGDVEKINRNGVLDGEKGVEGEEVVLAKESSGVDDSIEAETVPVGKNSDGPFPDSSEILAPNTEKVGNSDVPVDGDVEKINRNGVLDGEKGVKGEEVVLAKESSGVCDSGGSSGIVEGARDDSKGGAVEGLEGKLEVLASVENDWDLNLDESGGGGVVGSTVEGQDKLGAGAKEENSGSAVVGEKEVEDIKVNDAHAETEAKEIVDEDTVLSNDVEPVDGEKEKPGVAVVGETAEAEAANVKEAELPGAGGMTLDSSSYLQNAVLEKADGIGADTPISEPAAGYDVEQIEHKSLQPVDDAAEAGKGQELGIGGTVDAFGIVNGPETLETKNTDKPAELEIEQMAASQANDNETVVETNNDEVLGGADENQADNLISAIKQYNNEPGGLAVQSRDAQESVEAESEAKDQIEEEDAELDGSISDHETDGMIFGSSEAAKQFIEELERESGAESSHDHLQRSDGQIVTDSDEEVDTDDEGEGKEVFDSAALAALLKAATGADVDGSSITIASQDGSRLFSVERPAGLGSSVRSLRPTPRPNHPNIFAPSSFSNSEVSENNLSDEEMKKLDKLQEIRVKFLRLVHRLSLSPDESVAAQVLYRLAFIAGRQSGQAFSLDAAKQMALELEAKEKDDLNFSVNILVLGKCGVGKSATINSIFGEEKVLIDAFQPATTTVKEIVGHVNGVKIRVFDTPGLRCSAMEQAVNRSILSTVKKFTEKNPPDIVLYVDRLDTQSRDLNDLPLLKTVTSSLGPSIWKSAIVTLTHAASAPPDGPSGSPLSYEVFVTQRSHVLQQSIGHAVGDLRMMSPSLMNPVSLVENHHSCRKNREGHKVLPNGQSWRPQLLLLCYSMKILSEANSLSKAQDQFDHRKLFGFRARSPPLPYMLSSMLQSRAHPKLPSEQGADNGDSDLDLDDLSDIDDDEEDEYDELPPFKPLKKAQISKLSKEQRNAYFEEYDYRVKLLQKKQWKEELKRMREIKKKGKDASVEYGYAEENADSGAAAPVAVPLPDMVLPPSFDSDNPAYRYRFLEPTSQFLARPVLDTHGWDHDCGYEGVNVEQNLAIAGRFPAAVTVQITKDKKDFTLSLDSSIAAKHGENGSSMAGFDIQSIGKQLAYIVRGETKFKNLKKNKTAGGISVTFLGENVVTGVKCEDQITLGKQYVLVGSAGAVRSQHDTAYGANFELQRRELDYPIGQVQSTFSMSVIKWRGDLALGFNSLVQFSVGRGSKVAVRAGINNKLSGQITVRTRSSEHLSLAFAAVIPTAIAFYKKLRPSAGDKYSIY